MNSEYIVRLKRRKDGKRYFIRHDGCTTARYESAMKLDYDTARKLAKAIDTQHKSFRAICEKYKDQKKVRTIK